MWLHGAPAVDHSTPRIGVGVGGTGSRFDHTATITNSTDNEVCATTDPVDRPPLVLTLSDMTGSRRFSARFESSIVERLEELGAQLGMSKSRLAQRYIDEGIRMEDHPGVVFRDGPTGRRAGLMGGPDVWQVIAAVQSIGTDSDNGNALEEAAQWGNLSIAQVRTAVTYHVDYPHEVDARIRHNVDGADAAEERWRH